MSSALIITHNDFDGIFSGAILLAGLKPRRLTCDVQIAAPKRLARALTEHLGGFTLPDEVYIADLALNANQEDDVLRVLNQVRERGGKVYWFDHHRWDKGVYDRAGYVCDRLVVDTAAKTAAQLIRDTLFPQDALAGKLFRLLYRQEPEAGTPWAQEWFACLEHAVNSRSDAAVRRATFRIAYHDRPGLLATIGMRFARFGRRTFDLDRLPRRMEQTNAGRALLVIDLRNCSENINRLYRDIVEKYAPDIYIAVLDDTQLQCGRGQWAEFSLEPFLDGSALGTLRAEVKGHRYVGAVTLRPSLRSALRALLRRGYNDETEQFIALVRSRY